MKELSNSGLDRAESVASDSAEGREQECDARSPKAVASDTRADPAQHKANAGALCKPNGDIRDNDPAPCPHEVVSKTWKGRLGDVWTCLPCGQVFELYETRLDELAAANAEIERLKAGHLELSRQAEEWEQQTFALRRQIDALTAALRTVWSELNEGRGDEAKAEARKAINLADADRVRGG